MEATFWGGGGCVSLTELKWATKCTHVKFICLIFALSSAGVTYGLIAETDVVDEI